MIELLRDSLADAFGDTARLIPFLFLTYLVMEVLERRTEEQTTEMLGRAGRLGPLFGAAAGVLPQCGFSAAAASLYAGGVISIGTLLAVFLSTSDEMLPIFLSEAVPLPTIFRILGTKILLGAVTGLGLDAVLRMTRYRYKTERRIHDLCEQDHCGCEEAEGSVLRSALVHTLKIAAFLLGISFLITLVAENIGEETVSGLLAGRPLAGILLSGIIGLIPNCASSILITRLYLDRIIGPGQMMAGLLVSAGVGLLVLFRANRHLRENLKIAAVLYCAGVGWGLIIQVLGITF